MDKRSSPLDFLEAAQTDPKMGMRVLKAVGTRRSHDRRRGDGDRGRVRLRVHTEGIRIGSEGGDRSEVLRGGDPQASASAEASAEAAGELLREGLPELHDELPP